MTLLNTYEKDFFKWANDQAELLRKEEFTKLDMENLIEEIEALGRSEKWTLKSFLINNLMHKLKVKYQPEKHTQSWENSILESSIMLNNVLKENPSLKPKLKEMMEFSYQMAKFRAAKETQKDLNIFPKECPWKLNEIFTDLEEKYW